MKRPVHQSKLGWALCFALFAFLNLDFLSDLFRVPLAISLELALAVVVFQVIKWADAYEPEPMAAMLWAILAGSSISIFLVSIAYQIEGTNDFGVAYVGFIEEFAKGLILIPIFKSDLIHSWIDGYVYGSLIGLGFSISEDYLYAAFEPDPIDIILDRGLQSIFAHSLFSGLIGAALAFAFSQKHRIGLLFALAGVGSHVAWNTIVVQFIAAGNNLATLLTPLLFVLVANKLRREEIEYIEKIAVQLSSEGKIDAHEYRLLSDLNYRNSFRKNLQSRKTKKAFDETINKIVTGRV